MGQTCAGRKHQRRATDGSSEGTSAMTDQWQYQIRIYLGDQAAAVARRNPNDPAIAALAAILANHDAAMKCQFDAFA
jgi:hypothetical protein